MKQLKVKGTRACLFENRWISSRGPEQLYPAHT